MAFRVAISGLKAASGELDVIGNNIANSNTTGFKKSRAEFVDVFAVSSVGGSGNTPGSGVRLSAIKQQFSQGNVSFTDNSLDMAINGSGFFILDDNGSQIYSRAGAFGVDRNGFLANGEGQNLIAFGADASGNITGAAGPIQVNSSNISPQASTSMTIDLNLDAAQTSPAITTFNVSNPNSFNHSTSTTIFDSLGNSHLSSMYYVKKDTPAVATTVTPGAFTTAVSDGTPATQNDSAVGGAHTTSVAAAGSGGTYSITVDGVIAASITDAVNTPTTTNTAGAFTTITQGGGSGDVYSLTVDGVAIYSETEGVGDGSVTAAEIDGANGLGNATVLANLAAAGITFTGTAAANNLVFSKTDGSAFNVVVVNDTGAGGFGAGDFATGTNAASNAGTSPGSVTAAEIDTQLTANTAALNTAGITFTGTAAGGDLVFSRTDGASFNTVVANSYTGTAGGFAGADLAVGTNTVNNGAVAVGVTDTAFTMSIDGTQFFTEAAAISGTVTGAELDAALSTFVAGSGGAYSIVSGTIAGGDLVLSKADGSDVALTIDSNFSNTAGAFAGALASTNGTLSVSSNDWDAYTYVDGTQVGGPDSLSFSTTGSLTTPAGGVINIAAFTPSGGGAPITMTQDYSASTQFGSAFSVNGLSQDGFTTGRLSGLDIDGQGIIFARFTNGQSSIQGQIALADFANSQGLQPISDTSWGETFASGAVTIGSPGTASLGLIQAGSLEQSNVDLSEELVNMIIAQRSFQANAEVISTSDTITQSIINLR